MKKLILALITTLLGVLSSGAMAQTYTVTATKNNVLIDGTTYNFAAISNSYNSQSALFQSQPWWGDASKAQSFASAAGNFGLQPNFIYSVNGDGINYNAFYYQSGRGDFSSGRTSNIQQFGAAIVTSSSAGVPEIDGALAPKMGFLLACLSLMFGRKKENTETLMTA